MKGATKFISVFDPGAEYRLYSEEINRAVLTVLESGGYILGDQVARFEEELSSYLGVRHVVGLASGTDALIIGLRACGIRPGDEVITTPFSFIATATAILHAGAKPVFADISLQDYNLDPESVLACVTKKTRAIIPVHLYGHPAPMDDLRRIAEEYGLAVIEDAAQGLGADVKGRKVGTLGHAAAFSFYPTKTLGGYGDGGAIATNDEEIAERARALRDHGSVDGNVYAILGYNSRLDEIQAAALRVKLRHLDEMLERRRSLASAYGELLQATDVVIPRERKEVRHAFGLYTVRYRNRKHLADFLLRRNVGYGIYYPRLVFEHPLFRDYSYEAMECKRARLACHEVISLPMHSGLSPEEIQHIFCVLKEWMGIGNKKR
ncbi:MAG: DegT/DnrJ/EryC1/StrS family aminotransferase [Actinobacteria bacterium]|nr:DegT/DnrJ/EryC1/StrS family aminotransferase [Actinomycetota bacterium]